MLTSKLKFKNLLLIIDSLPSQSIKNRLKAKFFGILLFLCFVAPLASTFIFLSIQKKQVKKEIKWKIIAGIEKEELVLLKFTEAEKLTQLKWKHSKEFEYKGEMYDIVETSIKGDTIYYWCWWDFEETKLNKQLDNLVSLAFGNNPKKQENQQRLQQFFKSLYFSESIEKHSIACFHLNKLHYNYSEFYQTIVYSPPIPPPKIS
jgi:hypothetical protein